MKLALHQGRSAAGDRQAALRAVTTSLGAAAAAGADCVLFPELFLPGYNCDPMPGVAQAGLAAELGALARAARCGLVIGYAEAAEGGLFNSAMALGADGGLLCHYRKVQLFGAREKRLFRPGDAIPTFLLGGLRAALLICYDIEFAPHVAALAAAGVDLVLVPTANMLPYTHVSAATVPAMAANQALTIAYANYCGSERDLTYAGGSLVADPAGEVLARAGAGDCLIICDLPGPYPPSRLSAQAADFRPVPVR